MACVNKLLKVTIKQNFRINVCTTKTPKTKCYFVNFCQQCIPTSINSQSFVYLNQFATCISSDIHLSNKYPQLAIKSVQITKALTKSVPNLFTLCRTS